MSSVDTCPDCGQHFEKDEAFCKNCGHAFASAYTAADRREEGAEEEASMEAGRPRFRLLRRAIVLIVLGLAAIGVCSAVFLNGEVEIADAGRFPDEALQGYLSELVDTDGNGKLSRTEIDAVTALEGFQDRGITSLEGIEIFGNLGMLDASNGGIEKLFRTH
ncbi:hypothetical protein [Eggerthella sinensis]|uniref:hypothetical protein n=1 Tax=Eggerthella sinensis TaxID=242230 RepID=UPI00266CE08C|nr:hypothetical protein [Eggerthella sinensis]